MTNPAIDDYIVFDTKFNHPSLRDITVGKEYRIAGTVPDAYDDSIQKPYIVDDSGDENAKALEVCVNNEYRIVRNAQSNVEPEKAATTKHRYIVSYHTTHPTLVVMYGNIAVTIEGELDADEVLSKMLAAAANQVQVGQHFIQIDGIFKL